MGVVAMDGVVALKRAKDYVDETLQGAGALKGKNVQVAKIEPIIGGNRVTFSYYTNDNVAHSSSMEVMNGEQGVSVVSANIDKNNIVTFVLSNGETITAGSINIDSKILNLDDYYTKEQTDEKFVQTIQLNDLVDEQLNETFIAVTKEDIQQLFE